MSGDVSMPQLNKSEAVRQRLRVFLQRMIAFANYELSECERLEDKISVRWVNKDTTAPKLIVKSEIRFLAALVFETSDAKAKSRLKQDLRTLKDFVGRLEDNRDRTQGTGLWHFTLLLWHSSTARNLAAFDTLWQQRKAQAKVNSEAPSTTPPKATSPKATAKTDHNLPTRSYDTFIGRERDLAQLLTYLSAEHPVARISLVGVGGIGKTALALEAAYRCVVGNQLPSPVQPFPTFDAIIFTSAKAQQFTPQGILPRYRYSRTLQDLFRAIAKTLKCTDLLTGSFETQRENIYEVLLEQRTLLILDNLESLSEQNQQAVLAFLYELPAAVKTIVTSRVHLTMDAVIPLSKLSSAEAEAFIQHQAALKSVPIEHSVSQQLYQRTGGTPAAMVYALGQMAAGYAMPTVLPALSQQTSDYSRYYLESTVQSLVDLPAYKLLIALSMFPGSAPHDALVEIAQLSDTDTVESFARLRQRSLIIETDTRCETLPLTREYLITQKSEGKLHDSLRLQWTDWHQQWLAPYRDKNWREWHDYAAIDQEWDSLQAAVDWCIGTSAVHSFEQLWAGLRGYTHLRGYWHERLAWLEWWLGTLQVRQQEQQAVSLLSSVDSKRDFAVQNATEPNPTELNPITLKIIEAQCDLAWTLTMLAAPEQLAMAKSHFANAWENCSQLEAARQIEIAIDYAVLCLFQTELTQGEHWLHTADELLASADMDGAQRQSCQLRLDYYTAQLYYRKGNYARAKALYHSILKRVEKDAAVGKLVGEKNQQSPAQALQQQQIEAYSLNWLVDIALADAELAVAEELLEKSWPIVRQRQDLRSQAFHARSQAQLEQKRGRIPQFERWCQSAIESFRQLGMKTQIRELEGWLQESGAGAIDSSQKRLLKSNAAGA